MSLSAVSGAPAESTPYPSSLRSSEMDSRIRASSSTISIRSAPILFLSVRSLRRLLRGDFHLERRALARDALDADDAAVLLHDVLADGQAESRSFARVL